MAGEYVYLNDRLVEAGEARVSVFDAGLLHGVGLFETMRAYNGVVFRLGDHLERLRSSAGKLGLTVPEDTGPWREAVGRLLEANGLQEARVRLTVTPGAAGLLDEQGQVGRQAVTVLITAGAMAAYPAEWYGRGMTVLVSGYRQSRQDPLCGHKTTSYFSRLIALREAQMAGCGEALWFTTENLLAEGCISNVFVVKAGVVRTPPVDTPVLAGITRKVVMELAAAEGIELEERALTIDDLLGAEEVFLTNSVMELMPVCRIERHAVGDERPGAVTMRLAEAYRRAVEAECGAGSGGSAGGG